MNFHILIVKNLSILISIVPLLTIHLESTNLLQDNYHSNVIVIQDIVGDLVLGNIKSNNLIKVNRKAKKNRYTISLEESYIDKYELVIKTIADTTYIFPKSRESIYQFNFGTKTDSVYEHILNVSIISSLLVKNIKGNIEIYDCPEFTEIKEVTGSLSIHSSDYSFVYWENLESILVGGKSKSEKYGIINGIGVNKIHIKNINEVYIDK